jgi:hypothetical protein
MEHFIINYPSSVISVLAHLLRFFVISIHTLSFPQNLAHSDISHTLKSSIHDAERVKQIPDLIFSVTCSCEERMCVCISHFNTKAKATLKEIIRPQGACSNWSRNWQHGFDFPEKKNL